MVKAPTLDSVLDAAMQLPSTHRDMLVEILNKRQIETRRDEIATRAREAKASYRTGTLTTETAEELIERLHATGEEAEDDE